MIISETLAVRDIHLSVDDGFARHIFGFYENAIFLDDFYTVIITENLERKDLAKGLIINWESLSLPSVGFSDLWLQFLPHGAFLSLLTPDGWERVGLASYREHTLRNDVFLEINNSEGETVFDTIISPVITEKEC